MACSYTLGTTRLRMAEEAVDYSKEIGSEIDRMYDSYEKFGKSMG